MKPDVPAQLARKKTAVPTFAIVRLSSRMIFTLNMYFLDRCFAIRGNDQFDNDRLRILTVTHRILNRFAFALLHVIRLNAVLDSAMLDRSPQENTLLRLRLTYADRLPQCAVLLHAHVNRFYVDIMRRIVTWYRIAIAKLVTQNHVIASKQIARINRNRRYPNGRTGNVRHHFIADHRTENTELQYRHDYHRRQNVPLRLPKERNPVAQRS